jgi:hypothetical protein
MTALGPALTLNVNGVLLAQLGNVAYCRGDSNALYCAQNGMMQTMAPPLVEPSVKLLCVRRRRDASWAVT